MPWFLLYPSCARVAPQQTGGTDKLPFLFENYALDCDRRELRRGTHLMPVEPKVFDLLAYLVQNREHVVSRDELIAAVWDGRIISESALASCINAARSAVGDNGEEQRLIKTLPRKGIRFVGSVQEANQLDTPVAELPSERLLCPTGRRLLSCRSKTSAAIRNRSILPTGWWRTSSRDFHASDGCL